MSAKNVDSHNRWRSRNISFRMSPEEAAQLDLNVKLSRLTKQDYITQCLLNREVRVYGKGNPVEELISIHAPRVGRDNVFL